MTRGKIVNTAPFRDIYPFDSHFLDRGGLRLHYLDEGRGDPVILLHGNPTWSFYYRRLVMALSHNHRVIAPDHMGCGLSDKPPTDCYDYRLQSRVEDLTALIDHLDLDRPITLVVHDWGGMIGLCWALENRHRLGRLVITNTAGFLPPGNKPIPWRLRLIRSLAPFAVPAVLGFNLFSAAAVYMAPKKKLPAKVRAGLTAPYNCPANRMATLKFVQDIPLLPGDPSYDRVRRTDNELFHLQGIPMLICWGRHDFVFDLDYFQEWKRRFPGAESHLFENAGHYLLEDEPEAVIETIKTFFNQHPIDAVLP